MKFKTLAISMGLMVFTQFAHAGISIGGAIENNSGYGGKESVNASVNTQVNGKDAIGYTFKDDISQGGEINAMAKICNIPIMKKLLPACQ